MLESLSFFLNSKIFAAAVEKIKQQQQQQHRVILYSFVCLSGFIIDRDLAISFIRNYLYFPCASGRFRAFLCVASHWLCIRICLGQKLFFNPVQSFAFARLFYVVRFQCDILKSTIVPYYLYCKSMNRHLNSILFIILSLLFGI